MNAHARIRMEEAKPAGERRSPVHAASKYAGDCAAGALLDPDEADLMRRAVSHMLIADRPERSPTGGFKGLSRVARAVYHALTRLAVRFEAIYPTVASIASEADYSVRHTHRALAELRGRLLIEWDHRCEKTGVPGKRGELVRQISNLYRLLRPPRLAALMAKLKPRQPRDAAAVWAERRRAQELEAWSTQEGELLVADIRARNAASMAGSTCAVSPAFNAMLDARDYSKPRNLPSRR